MRFIFQVLMAASAISAQAQDEGRPASREFRHSKGEILPELRATRDETSVEEKFIDVVRSLKPDSQDEKEVKNEFLAAIQSSEWNVKSFTLRRFKVRGGLTTSIRIRIETGDSCVKNQRWIELIGKPRGLTLAEPLSFIDISTPEAVDRHLSDHVISLNYRLDENYAYSIVSNRDSGCFNYLVVY